MNLKLEENKHFFDRWAQSYDAPWFQFWMKRFHRPVLEELRGARNLKILDLSCGTGQLLSSLCTQNKTLKLAGVDYSRKMIQVARKRLPASIKLYPADVHKLPFRRNTFDCVVSTEAFHHYYQQPEALAEMKRVAKTGGKMMVVDINFFLPPIHWLFQKLELGCVKINSRKEMQELFEKQGIPVLRQQRSFLFAVMTLGVKR